MRLALLLLVPLPTFCQQPWIYSEEVALGEVIRSVYEYSLGDGRQIRFMPDKSTLPMVESWTEGKPLLLAYAPIEGPIMVNPVDGKWVKLAWVTGKHPIDAIQEKCLDSREGFTTSGMVGCFNYSTQHWHSEVQRLLKLLFVGMKPPQRSALQTAQTRWEQFYKAQLNALDRIDTDGTISRVNRAGAASQLVQERAASLAALYGR